MLIFEVENKITVSKNKLHKFSEVASFKNVYQCFNPKEPVLIGCEGEEVDLKGKWNSLHFKKEQAITLELACGGGEYTLALSRMYPDRHFIGVDVKGSRIWKGARVALTDELDNAAFLRTRIEQITHFLDKDEVDEIWITFPDPFLRKSKWRRRLTSLPFLKRYQQFLKPGGFINLKTDSSELYAFTLETIAETKCVIHYQNDNIYTDELFMPELEFKTYYEKMHLLDERTIKFVRFSLPDSL